MFLCSKKALTNSPTQFYHTNISWALFPIDRNGRYPFNPIFNGICYVWDDLESTQAGGSTVSVILLVWKEKHKQVNASRYLDSFSKIITSAFLVENRLMENRATSHLQQISRSHKIIDWNKQLFTHLIDFSCSNVVISSKSHVQESFIVTQIQVNLSSECQVKKMKWYFRTQMKTVLYIQQKKGMYGA